MGLKVTITDNENGTYTVGESDDDQPTAGAAPGADTAGAGSEDQAGAPTGDEGGDSATTQGGDDNGSPEGQTVNSIGEALRIARDLLTNDKQVEDANNNEDPNAPLSKDQAKSEWNDQATKTAQAKALFNK